MVSAAICYRFRACVPSRSAAQWLWYAGSPHIPHWDHLVTWKIMGTQTMSQDEFLGILLRTEMFVGFKSLHSPKVQPVSRLKSVLHDELSFVFKLFSGTTLTCKRNPFKKKQTKSYKSKGEFRYWNKKKINESHRAVSKAMLRVKIYQLGWCRKTLAC